MATAPAATSGLPKFLRICPTAMPHILYTDDVVALIVDTNHDTGS
jgi:hypothetical protein